MGLINITGSQLGRSPFVRAFLPWENFTRVTPLFWIILVGVLMMILGLNFGFLRFFAWIGGFLTFFFVALGISIFRSL